MVAGFQDDLDSDDVELSETFTKPTATQSQNIDLSSDNEDSQKDVDDIQAKPVIQPDLDLDSDADNSVLNDNEPSIQRTPLNVYLSSGNQSSLKTMIKDTEKKASDTKESSFSAIVNEPDSDESNDEQCGNPTVTVLADEDISDDDTTSSKPVDSGLATDTTQVIYCFDLGSSIETSMVLGRAAEETNFTPHDIPSGNQKVTKMVTKVWVTV